MKFGQYELLERVAVGGMAEVYRGRVAGAEGFEKWVAIKRILPEFARDDRFISMMLTEARIHSGLSHGNIVQIHDLGISEDGEYFIVLEYVEGHDLRAIMEAASELGVQIPDSLALHVADELAQALHFAHELTDAEGQPLGIIHRDVSPSNVLISNSGEVKLSDFGIAKRRHDHSFVGSLKGNLVYMSPEQAQRVPLDRRTDVFSLGAVLFEMLTGHKLRDITDEVNGFRDVASGVVRSARALRPDLPEAYEALLARALAANPADRFPDAAAFGAAIRALGRESDAPVGPADMKELVELLNPPRRARSPVERSKVIRLGPEFRALAGSARGARAGASADTPTTPAAPALALAPGMIPAGSTSAPSTNGNGGPVWAHDAARLATATPGPNFTSPPTPPPPLVLSPPASVRQTSSTSTMPLPAFSLPTGEMQATPPPPVSANVPTPAPADAPHSRPTLRLPPSAPRSPATARFPVFKRPTGTPPPTQTPPPPVVVVAPHAAPEADLSMPTPPPAANPFGAGVPGVAGVAGVGGAMAFRAPLNGSAAAAAAAEFHAPPSFQNAPLAPAAVVLRAGAPFEPPYPAGAAGPSTAVVAHQKRRKPWGSFLILLLAALSGAAAVFHYKIVPLQVAVTWLKPASLSASSEPSGASVTLDGRTLTDKTPLRVDVRRDRADHVLEFSHPGHSSVRTTTRFDRTVELSESVTLPALPPPPPPPPPPPAETAPAPVAAEPRHAPKTKAQLKAEKKAEKKAEAKAAKQAKLSASKSAKHAAKQKKATKKAKAAHKKKGADAGSGAEL